MSRETELGVAAANATESVRGGLPADLPAPSLLVVAGSHAYGTERPDSDTDYRGIFTTRTELVWSLTPPPDTFERSSPDVVMFEVEKYMRLALAGNPNALEFLWCPRLEYDIVGGMLIAHRALFLSRRVLRTYGGYAMQQLRKAHAGTGGSRGAGHMKREKFILHLLRLLEQGTGTLETGDLTIRVSDPDRLREMGTWPLDRIDREFRILDARMKEAALSSPLPEHPDMDHANALLDKIRRESLTPDWEATRTPAALPLFPVDHGVSGGVGS